MFYLPSPASTPPLFIHNESSSSDSSSSPYTPIDPPQPSSVPVYVDTNNLYPAGYYTHYQYIDTSYQQQPVYAPTPVLYEQTSVADFFQAGYDYGQQNQHPPSPPQLSYPSAPPSFSHQQPAHNATSYPSQVFEDQPSGPPSSIHTSKPLQLTIPTPADMLIEATAANNLPPVQDPNLSWNGIHTHNDPRIAGRVRRSASTASFVSASASVSTPSSTTGSPPSPQGTAPSVDLPLPLPIPPNESISSHEKKRHYLECLEYYVLFLHQQLQLVGAVPVGLERADLASGRSGVVGSMAGGTKGMSSRSIRTLLVHMKHKNREMDAKILEEEQKFLTLRNLVAEKEAARGKNIL